MKPTPLPPDPKLIDRVEYILQWLVGWIIIDIPNHPMVSGLLTGFLMLIPIIGIVMLVCLVLKLLHVT